MTRCIEGEVVQVLPPQRRTSNGLFDPDAVTVFDSDPFVNKTATVIRAGDLPPRRFDLLKRLVPLLFRRDWDDHHPTVLFDEDSAPGKGDCVEVEAQRVRDGTEVGWVPV